MSAVLAFVLLTAIIMIISIMAGAAAKLYRKNRFSCLKRYRSGEAHAYASLPAPFEQRGQGFHFGAPAYTATNALALEWNPDQGHGNGHGSGSGPRTLHRQLSNVKSRPLHGAPQHHAGFHHQGGLLKREHTWPATRVGWEDETREGSSRETWGASPKGMRRHSSNMRARECRSPAMPHRRGMPRPPPRMVPPQEPTAAQIAPVPKIEEIVIPEPKPVPTFTPSISLPEALWGFGTLMDRFLRKTTTKGVDAPPPLDYEGLFFMLQGVTTLQVLLMVLCLETMVFMDVPKHTNRVWTLVLKYYVENTAWKSDERIPSIPTSIARAKYGEANKLVLAWHLFERQCVERLEKYFDPEERMKALKQAEICLPRKDPSSSVIFMNAPSSDGYVKKAPPNGEDTRQQHQQQQQPLNPHPLAREDAEPTELPDAKRPKRGGDESRAAMRTPPRPSRESDKKPRSPAQVCEEPSPKRQQFDGEVELTPAEYTYRSVEGELRVFTIQRKDDGLLFTQTSKSCSLLKAGDWYVGDLGQGYRVRVQAVGEKGKTGGAYIVEIQFAPGPKKRWQAKLTATSTK